MKESTDQKQVSAVSFPLDAFEFTEPGAATQLLTLLRGLAISTGGLTMHSGSTIRKITISTSSPSGTPADGDIWLKRAT